ncbi:MAG: DMT family transporter [Acidobacteria bacterium]|nr:DMT family transporter [Acidobacteriota bacterium]
MINARAGFTLSLLTAILWGSLPVALRPILERLDPVTITWVRYVAAAAGMAIFVARSRAIPNAASLSPRHWLLLGAALGGFLGNNFGYLIGLRNTSPAAAQILIQLAPILVIFGAAYLFKEPFGRWQVAGVTLLAAGVLLFFHHRLAAFTAGAGGAYFTGVAAVLCAAALWAIYALAQKELLRSMSSIAIMAFVYCTGSVAMLPFATPSSLRNLDAPTAWLLAYCCLNSLLGYGFFSEALARWHASRVSAVVALAPLFTVLFQFAASRRFPHQVTVEHFDLGNIAGALLVVAGCMATSLGKSKPAAD